MTCENRFLIKLGDGHRAQSLPVPPITMRKIRQFLAESVSDATGKSKI